LPALNTCYTLIRTDTLKDTQTEIRKEEIEKDIKMDGHIIPYFVHLIYTIIQTHRKKDVQTAIKKGTVRDRWTFACFAHLAYTLIHTNLDTEIKKGRETDRPTDLKTHF
jgi:hypothetical protein